MHTTTLYRHGSRRKKRAKTIKRNQYHCHHLSSSSSCLMVRSSFLSPSSIKRSSLARYSSRRCSISRRAHVDSRSYENTQVERAQHAEGATRSKVRPCTYNSTAVRATFPQCSTQAQAMILQESIGGYFQTMSRNGTARCFASRHVAIKYTKSPRSPDAS